MPPVPTLVVVAPALPPTGVTVSGLLEQETGTRAAAAPMSARTQAREVAERALPRALATLPLSRLGL
jgi:hypothetical protein